ncbi:MAG TPA: hypothetical protein VF458_06415 [Ktedonobacteraceae bacterium]
MLAVFGATGAVVDVVQALLQTGLFWLGRQQELRGHGAGDVVGGEGGIGEVDVLSTD